MDANDLLYAVEASHVGILEKEIKRVRNGKAVVLPLTPETHGHGSHTAAVLWEQYLKELLAD